MKQLRIALVILTMNIAYSGYGQYFSNLYIDGRPSMLFGSIQQLNGKLYVTGVTTTTRNSNYQKAVFGKISDTGHEIFINSIVDSDSYSYDIFYNSLKRTTKGNFITTGYVNDSTQKAFLMEVDTNGQILLWHEYTESDQLIFQGQDIVEIPDSGFLLAVNVDFADVSNVRLIRTDLAGNIIEQNNYFFGQLAIPSVIRSMFNGHYMVGAFSLKPNPNTPYWSKTWLIEVDRMGNMIRDWKDTSNKNSQPFGMEQTADSGWIITRQHVAYDLANVQAYNGSVLKLDKNFNKQWEIDTGGYDFNAGTFDVKILNDGNYICVGSEGINITQDSSLDYGWLMKVSAEGKIIWQRDYAADISFEAANYLNSIALMPDGSFAACGRTESGTYGQQGWIIRTDSTGCLLNDCGREMTAIDNTSPMPVKIKCYPNPASDYLIVETQNIIPDALLQITDNLGRMVFQQKLNATDTQLSLSNQPDGIYFVRVSNSTGVLGASKVVVMH